MLLVIVNNNEYNKDCLNGQLKHKVFCNILDEQQWTQLAKVQRIAIQSELRGNCKKLMGKHNNNLLHTRLQKKMSIGHFRKDFIYSHSHVTLNADSFM